MAADTDKRPSMLSLKYEYWPAILRDVLAVPTSDSDSNSNSNSSNSGCTASSAATVDDGSATRVAAASTALPAIACPHCTLLLSYPTDPDAHLIRCPVCLSPCVLQPDDCIGWVKALFDFDERSAPTGAGVEYVSLRAGDKVAVVDRGQGQGQAGEEWWYGELRVSGRRGFFPANHVTELISDQPWAKPVVWVAPINSPPAPLSTASATTPTAPPSAPERSSSSSSSISNSTSGTLPRQQAKLSDVQEYEYSSHPGVPELLRQHFSSNRNHRRSATTAHLPATGSSNVATAPTVNCPHCTLLLEYPANAHVIQCPACSGKLTLQQQQQQQDVQPQPPPPTPAFPSASGPEWNSSSSSTSTPSATRSVRYVAATPPASPTVKCLHCGQDMVYPAGFELIRCPACSRTSSLQVMRLGASVRQQLADRGVECYMERVCADGVFHGQSIEDRHTGRVMLRCTPTELSWKMHKPPLGGKAQDKYQLSRCKVTSHTAELLQEQWQSPSHQAAVAVRPSLRLDVDRRIGSTREVMFQFSDKSAHSLACIHAIRNMIARAPRHTSSGST